MFDFFFPTLLFTRHGSTCTYAFASAQDSNDDDRGSGLFSSRFGPILIPANSNNIRFRFYAIVYTRTKLQLRITCCQVIDSSFFLFFREEEFQIELEQEFSKYICEENENKVATINNALIDDQFFFFEKKNICIQSWRVELEQTCSKYIFEAAITSNVLLLYKSFLNIFVK